MPTIALADLVIGWSALREHGAAKSPSSIDVAQHGTVRSRDRFLTKSDAKPIDESKVIHMTGSQCIQRWPEESREAAQLVIKKYGEPDEATDSLLIWHHRGHWKRIIASKAFFKHNFPAPHIDSVECVIEYRVPIGKFTPLAQFDGSVIVERTAGEVSARCHDEQANLLALNLMHDIVTGAKTVHEARGYYAKEFADYRRKKPTPYMEGLRFSPVGSTAADADSSILSDSDLDRARQEGESAT